jgi:DNA-binding MarR family transcriptional regulator
MKKAKAAAPAGETVTDRDYARLLEFRTGLRQFLRWSERQAAAAGLTAAQHQLLLAVRGHPDPRGPTIGEVADHLLLRHHSAVELAARAEMQRLVHRTPDPDDKRVTRLVLTASGRRRLDELTALHLEELRRLGPDVRRLWAGIEDGAAG